mgnify:CR=1 FL=1
MTDFVRKMMTGVGFMADTYDLFIINMVVEIMKDIYTISAFDETMIKVSALLGSVVGQLFFGINADKIGRKKIFISTCLLTIFGSISSAIVGNTGAMSIAQWLIFTRFFLGIGVGGEYPLSATITAENEKVTNDEKITNLCTTFSMQGVGQLLSGIVLIIATQCIEDQNLQWRLALAVGALPMICSFYYRWTMDETFHFKKTQINGDKVNNPMIDNVSNIDTENGNKNMDNTELEYLEKSKWDIFNDNLWQIIGTGGTWFLLDIVFYANGLFSGTITKAMGTSDNNKSAAIQVFILQCISFPGYIVSIFLMAKQGPKYIQNQGFLAITFIFGIMAIFQHYLAQVSSLYIIIYGLTFFFENYGANASTYVIPAITFPTEVRATCHGISAAMGKMGAVFGVLVLLYMKNGFCQGECDDDEDNDAEKGLRLTFGFCAMVGIIGFFWSRALVSDKVHSSLHNVQ